jgi:hypothetical protein
MNTEEPVRIPPIPGATLGASGLWNYQTPVHLYTTTGREANQPLFASLIDHRRKDSTDLGQCNVPHWYHIAKTSATFIITQDFTGQEAKLAAILAEEESIVRVFHERIGKLRKEREALLRTGGAGV